MLAARCATLSIKRFMTSREGDASASSTDITAMISAIIRFLLLSFQTGYFASGLLVTFLCPEGNCGYGYGSALGGVVMAIGVWLLVAILTLILLVIHRNHTRKTKPQALAIQEQTQWVLVVILSFIFVVFDF